MAEEESAGARRQRFRHVAWTRNQTDQEIERDGPGYPEYIPWAPLSMAYMVQSKEIGTKEGRHHLQGYTKFLKQVSLSQAREMLPGCHLCLPTRGTALENRLYVLKGQGFEKAVEGNLLSFKPESEFVELGMLPTPGKAASMIDVCHLIRQGNSIGGILRGGNEHDVSICRHMKHYREFADAVADDQKHRCMPEVYVLIGESRSGKTAYADGNWREAHPEWRSYGVVSKSGNNGQGWFDGYDDHEVMIFDNMGHNCQFDYDFLMEICDRYPKKVPVKGGYRSLRNLKQVYFTSIHEPHTWWGRYTGSDYIYRSEIVEFTNRITKQYSVERVSPLVWNIIRLSASEEEIITNIDYNKTL